MGLGPAAVRLNLELKQRGLLEDVASVVDLGSQELHLGWEQFERLVTAAGLPAPGEEFAALRSFPGHPRCAAAPFYRLLGIGEYACVDLNAEHGAIALDLSKPLDDRELWGRFGMVTDHGTAEHVFDVAEVYRTIHRLCAPGGLIVAAQAVYNTNGFYAFDLSFYEALAAANGYEVLFAGYTVAVRAGDTVDEFIVPLSRELIESFDWTGLLGIGLAYVMRKTGSDDFREPAQGPYMSKALGNRGYEMQFLPDPPRRTYVPLVGDEIPIPTGELARLLVRRVGRKLGGAGGR